MKSISDEELVRLYLLSQHRPYIETLYQRYWPQVYGHCVWLTQDPEEAQDLTQDIFLQLGAKLAGFRHEARFWTWLKAITTNYCLTQLGIRQRHRARFMPISDSTLEIAQEDKPADWPEQIDETDRQVAQALSRLTPPEQQLALKYQDELSVSMLCHVLGMGPSAVKMRLLRSRDKFRTYYQAARPGDAPPSTLEAGH